MYQQASMLALGFCNSENVSLLMEEMQVLIEDYSTTRTSVSAQALEVNHLVCGALPCTCLHHCHLMPSLH